MRVEKDIPAAREAVRDLQRYHRCVGLVPTMGALHAGHLSLVTSAKRQCDAVAVTIFVNPTQFGPQEDLTAYPRTLDADLEACREAGVDLVFTPDLATMYRDDATTTVRVGGLTETLCGPLRPGHFEGVTTVVAKLFHILPADAAFFGEKDFQQLQVIRRMVQDLDLAVEIVGCPTVREADGLAMSSRNAYLSPEQRRQATSLSQALFAAARQVAEGERSPAAVRDRVRASIGEAGAAEIEYVAVVDPATLADLETIDRPARACLAVRIGTTRLIDNVALDPPARAGTDG